MMIHLTQHNIEDMIEQDGVYISAKESARIEVTRHKDARDVFHLVPNTVGFIIRYKHTWLKDVILSGTILLTSLIVTLFGIYWHLTLLDVFGISNTFTIGISLVYKRFF